MQLCNMQISMVNVSTPTNITQSNGTTYKCSWGRKVLQLKVMQELKFSKFCKVHFLVQSHLSLLTRLFFMRIHGDETTLVLAGNPVSPALIADGKGSPHQLAGSCQQCCQQVGGRGGRGDNKCSMLYAVYRGPQTALNSFKQDLVSLVHHSHSSQGLVHCIVDFKPACFFSLFMLLTQISCTHYFVLILCKEALELGPRTLHFSETAKQRRQLQGMYADYVVYMHA